MMAPHRWNHCHSSSGPRNPNGRSKHPPKNKHHSKANGQKHRQKHYLRIRKIPSEPVADESHAQTVSPISETTRSEQSAWKSMAGSFSFLEKYLKWVSHSYPLLLGQACTTAAPETNYLFLLPFSFTPAQCGRSALLFFPTTEVGPGPV